MLLYYGAAFWNICFFNELVDIRLEMSAGISFRIDGGWFDFAFIYLVSLFGFLYGLYIPVLRLNVVSK